MSGSTIFFGAMIITFFIIAIATFYYISTKIGNDDTQKDVGNAIKTITICNVVLIVFIGFVSYIYTNNNPLVRPTYTLVMIHLSLLFSLTAVAISSIEKFGK